MSPSKAAPNRWARLFPLPLVGAAVLLAILIVLTPNLLSTGSPAAGNLATQAELLVDRATPGSNLTHLYVRALGLARYHSIALSWAPLPGSAPPNNLTGVNWSHSTQGTELLGLESQTGSSMFAVNATAIYIDSSGAGATYSAAFAFQWVGSTLTTTPYAGATGANPTDVSALPLVLLLDQGPYGGGP